ncbi:MAG: SlyX family protein [Gammaproteobacteria bacterium]|nr:SlyX family protein [Gammaproteobacteria bacterium]
METRLTDLEIRLTHQEAALEEMSDVLLKQHHMMESLQRNLAALQVQLRDTNPQGVADPSQEPPPPHY